nr:proline-rich protein 36-like [Aegilops tauschii subsp. strangulata]
MRRGPSPCTAVAALDRAPRASRPRTWPHPVLPAAAAAAALRLLPWQLAFGRPALLRHSGPLPAHAQLAPLLHHTTTAPACLAAAPAVRAHDAARACRLPAPLLPRPPPPQHLLDPPLAACTPSPLPVSLAGHAWPHRGRAVAAFFLPRRLRPLVAVAAGAPPVPPLAWAILDRDRARLRPRRSTPSPAPTCAAPSPSSPSSTSSPPSLDPAASTSIEHAALDPTPRREPPPFPSSSSPRVGRVLAFPGSPHHRTPDAVLARGLPVLIAPDPVATTTAGASRCGLARPRCLPADPPSAPRAHAAAPSSRGPRACLCHCCGSAATTIAAPLLAFPPHAPTVFGAPATGHAPAVPRLCLRPCRAPPLPADAVRRCHCWPPPRSLLPLARAPHARIAAGQVPAPRSPCSTARLARPGHAPGRTPSSPLWLLLQRSDCCHGSSPSAIPHCRATSAPSPLMPSSFPYSTTPPPRRLASLLVQPCARARRCPCTSPPCSLATVAPATPAFAQPAARCLYPVAPACVAFAGHAWPHRGRAVAALFLPRRLRPLVAVAAGAPPVPPLAWAILDRDRARLRPRRSTPSPAPTCAAPSPSSPSSTSSPPSLDPAASTSIEHAALDPTPRREPPPFPSSSSPRVGRVLAFPGSPHHRTPDAVLARGLPVLIAPDPVATTTAGASRCGLARPRCLPADPPSAPRAHAAAPSSRGPRACLCHCCGSAATTIAAPLLAFPSARSRRVRPRPPLVTRPPFPASACALAAPHLFPLTPCAAASAGHRPARSCRLLVRHTHASPWAKPLHRGRCARPRASRVQATHLAAPRPPRCGCCCSAATAAMAARPRPSRTATPLRPPPRSCPARSPAPPHHHRAGLPRCCSSRARTTLPVHVASLLPCYRGPRLPSICSTRRSLPVPRRPCLCRLPATPGLTGAAPWPPSSFPGGCGRSLRWPPAHRQSRPWPGQVA